MTTKTYKVNGMKCGFCKEEVETALKSVKGVVSAEASLANGTATVSYDENETTPQALKEAVDTAGHFEMVVE